MLFRERVFSLHRIPCLKTVCVRVPEVCFPTTPPTTALLLLGRKEASCPFLNWVSALPQGKSTGVGTVN